jgi:hypothetical protein
MARRAPVQLAEARHRSQARPPSPASSATAETLEAFSGRPTARAYVAGNALTVYLITILLDLRTADLASKPGS